MGKGQKQYYADKMTLASMDDIVSSLCICQSCEQ